MLRQNILFSFHTLSWGKRREGGYFRNGTLRFQRAACLAATVGPFAPLGVLALPRGPRLRVQGGSHTALPQCRPRTAGLKRPGRSLPCHAGPNTALQPRS